MTHASVIKFANVGLTVMEDVANGANGTSYLSMVVIYTKTSVRLFPMNAWIKQAIPKRNGSSYIGEMGFGMLRGYVSSV